MRLLRFFLIFLATAILVVGSIFWLNRDSFLTVFQNRASLMEGSEWVEKTYSLGGLVEFMAEQPQFAAIISITDETGREGSLQQDDDTGSSGSNGPHAIRQRAGQMHPAGTLSNLFLVITYADLVAAGELDPATPVDPETVATFYLPETDRRHQRTFERWVSDAGDTPGIEQLIRYHIRHNDPAVADYLYFFLDEDRVTETTLQLGEGVIEPPVPEYGLRMLALSFDPESTTLAERLEKLRQKNREELIEAAVSIARSQWENPAVSDPGGITYFQDQRALHNLYPHLQPDRFAAVLLAIRDGSLISEEVSAMVDGLLQRSPGDHLLQRHVSEYAAHFDERMGYMNGWSLARKNDTGAVQAQVILLYDLPAGLWFHMNSNFMIQDYHHRMLYDQNIRDRSHTLLMDPGPVSYQLYQH